MSLREALRRAEAYLEKRIPAVFYLSTPTKELGDYILEELTAVLVNADRYSLVDRQHPAFLQAEEEFQVFWEVSDASIQHFGQKVGAEVILLASFMSLGDVIG